MAKYNLKDTKDYLAALDFLSNAREKQHEVELKIYHPRRSNPQNRYLYFCLQWFAHEMGCTVIEAKEVYLKRIAAPHIFEREVRVGDETYPYYRSTADLDTVEMMSAIENFRTYADMHGHPIPDANEQELIRYCEREIEKTQGYGT